MNTDDHLRIAVAYLCDALKYNELGDSYSSEEARQCAERHLALSNPPGSAPDPQQPSEPPQDA